VSAAGPARRAAVTRADWETPPELFARLNAEFDFTLDAAARADNRKCEWYLGPGSPLAENALDCPSGFGRERIWCNPPYGNLGPWVRAFKTWAWAGAIVVALLPNATDTRWFREAAWTATEIRLVGGRIQFVGTTSSNPSGSIVAIWTPYMPPSGAHICTWR
jgi:phage N-6-adenine-methyltransferase